MQARSYLGTAAAILLSATALTAQATQKPAAKPAPAVKTAPMPTVAAKATDSARKTVASTDTSHKKARKRAVSAKKP